MAATIQPYEDNTQLQLQLVAHHYSICLSSYHAYVAQATHQWHTRNPPQNLTFESGKIASFGPSLTNVELDHHGDERAVADALEG